MDFTAKIKDYISDELEIKPFLEKVNKLQLSLDEYLEKNKSIHDEYTIDIFEEILKQQKAINSQNEVISSMKRKNRNLKNSIIQHLDLLKGGKLKLTIDNTSYLISKDGENIHLGKSFE